MWLLLLVINTIVVVSLTLYWNFATELRRFKRHLEFSKIIPGPSIIEILSNVRKDRVFDWILELRNRYGRLYRIWLGKELFVLIADPNDLRTVLTSNELLYKGDGYKFLEPWLGKGLLTNGGSDWHRRRKMLTPAFHFKILSAFQKPLEDNCNILIQKLKDVSANGKANINIYPYISLFTLDAICETAMGVKRHAQLKSDSAYVKAVQKICEVVQNRVLSAWRKYEFLYQFTSDAREGRNALRILHDETKMVIEQRRKLLEQESDLTLHKIENDDTFNTKRRLAFLDVLLIAQKEGVTITDREIREEVDTFMFAGHDTTSSAISFTIYLLSQHPEIQEKAYQEIIQTNGQDKEQMKYLEAVIKESLRLYPPAPAFSRTTKGDFKLGDITIPEGATITILSYVAHRNPKEYPDPEKFMPERYLEGSKQFHPFSSIAFSAGPRNCIADNFVVKPVAQIVMKGSDGILVKIRPRKRET